MILSVEYINNTVYSDTSKNNAKLERPTTKITTTEKRLNLSNLYIIK